MCVLSYCLKRGKKWECEEYNRGSECGQSTLYSSIAITPLVQLIYTNTKNKWKEPLFLNRGFPYTHQSWDILQYLGMFFIACSLMKSRCAVGIWWVKTKCASKHHLNPHPKNPLLKNVSSAQAEKTCAELWEAEVMMMLSTDSTDTNDW